MTGVDGWQITARDSDLHEVEWVSGYSQFKATVVDCDVGDFSLTVPLDHPAAGVLLSPAGVHGGIVVRPVGGAADEVILSGRVLEDYTTYSDDGDRLTVTGLDDNVLLSYATAAPVPTQDVPTGATTTFAQVSDVFTGTAEAALVHYLQANLGPTAPAWARLPFLTVPASQGRGPSGTWRPERYANLLQLLQDVATYGGLTFRVRQAGDGALAVDIREPVDRLDAVFSRTNGNLVRATIVGRDPLVEDVVVLGGGEGTARTAVRQSAPARPGARWRSTAVLDQRQTSTLAELQQAAQTELESGRGKGGMQLVAQDVPHCRFGVHYEVGDIGHASIAGRDVSERVVQVGLEHAEGGVPTVTPSLGAPDEEQTPELLAEVRRLQADVARLGRR